MAGTPTTESADYAERLVRIQNKWWKRLLPVQAPYRWNIRRLRPGFTLDVGCGTGRSLLHLDGNGVGVDHNLACLDVARRHGLTAMTPADFRASSYNAPGSFDTLLLSHVIEHMTIDQAAGLIAEYLPVLKPGGRVILVTPQERGQRSDATHVQFMDFVASADVLRRCGVDVDRQYSFPFPRMLGRWFIYNEFITVGRVRRPEEPADADQGRAVDAAGVPLPAPGHDRRDAVPPVV
jgi:SAM-dependent methyltransferase